MKKLIVLLSLFLAVGCAPKYTLTYDVVPSGNISPTLADKKIGIFLFEDNRPVLEKDRSTGRTMILGDSFFEKPVSEMFNELMVKHFNANMGNNGNSVQITKGLKEIDLQSFREDKIDFILFGALNHYTVSSYDSNYGKKMTGAIFAGLLAPIGLVLMPAVLSGECDLKSDIEIVDLYLFQTSEPQLLWRGNYKYNSSEKVTCTEITGEKRLETYSKNTQKAIQTIYENIVLSAEMQFPNKLSMNDSTKILNYIKSTGSVLNLNY